MLNGINISSYQAGLDPYKIEADFVIVKATEGRDYVSPEFEYQVKRTLESRKLLGLYHFLDGSSFEEEMFHFFWTVRPYLGKAVLCLDFQGDLAESKSGRAYLSKAISTLVTMTGGIRPFVYASKSVYPWCMVNLNRCGVWLAHWTHPSTVGYEPDTSEMAKGSQWWRIKQYTSDGHLDGWDEGLCLNKARLSKSDWLHWAGGWRKK